MVCMEGKSTLAKMFLISTSDNPTKKFSDINHYFVYIQFKLNDHSKNIMMNNKTEGIISSLAALLVLFTTMLNPWISIGLAVLFLFGLGIYHFTRKH